jgi:FAD/FMN-containing dehydrogenase
MNAPSFPLRFAEPRLAQRLRKELEAEILFDRASRGRYSTDASIYQIEPLGIVVPRTEEAARSAARRSAPRW